MVEQVRVNPEEVRGYGNICEGHTLEDFIVSNSGLAKEKENVHGALTDVYKLVYSVYGLMFDFDKGNKQLYLQMAEADTLSFGFDTVNKQLYLVDENDTGFNLGFDEDTNELYITDDAPPIVHDYSIALDQSSYTTTGSLSVSATLLDDGVAVEGATVSFTGGVSTVTATTNSSGVATATVNFTSSGTLTASYSNVSDTATVTVSQYIFYDDCTSDRSNEYTNASIQASNRTNYLSLTYSSNGYYTIKATSNEGNHYAKWITALDGKDNLKFTCEVSTNTFNGTNRFGIIIGDANEYKSERYHISNKTLEHLKQIGTSTETVIDSHTLSLTANTWYKMEYIVEGTSFTFTISDMSSNVLYTTTGTFDSSVITSSTTKQYGLYYLNYGSSYQKMFRNIKAEAL